MKNLFLAVASLIIFSISSCKVTESEEVNNADIERMIVNQHFTFFAQTSVPQSPAGQLTGRYDIRITRDSVVSFLPYFGRSFAPTTTMHQRDGGIKFNSKDFEITSEVRRTGGWEILIRPMDAIHVNFLNLNISPTGHATLIINMVNMQPMTFTGYISQQ